eukprot:CAMPEP_0183294330 /NCGR_PEP_ID=MMETSP0160_2-20130417/2719_1 /TAXON_ID=2839 ORGANISM="Odontella Sinensis, Strain Grunow 1884" /NCGR_SAMPLE_ID=MMETSP0160_2 /ASSEMBLY_ACC=CAM_ASM_000250 /LENGTH=362 /DNA_ID=CAMNT_0025455643 /DNA_START=43 /DNA_END=1131 /DNA_ORIENTATION=+
MDGNAPKDGKSNMYSVDSLSKSKNETRVPPAKSSWTIKSISQDSSFLPTLGVTLWLGWNGAVVYLVLYFIFLASAFSRAFLSILAVLSLSLPVDFWTAEGSPGRRMGDWCVRMGERYFGLITCVEDEDSLLSIPPDRAAVFALEPHDILPYSAFAMNSSLGRIPGKVGREHRCLMSSAIFRIPFLRQAYAWVGGASIDKPTFKRKLTRGESFTFVPGGVQEVTTLDPSCPSRDIVLYLMRRKGFIKIALVEGSPIVPVFCFGIEGSYEHWFPRSKIASDIGRRIGFLPMMYFGRWGVPYGIPNPQRLQVVVGSPIILPKLGETGVTEEAVNKYHTLFLTEMEALYERHKIDAGYGDRKLRII